MTSPLQVFLRELGLDGNRFPSVPSDALRYLFNLASLNLSGNPLGARGGDLGESSFDNVGGLKTLYLSGCDLGGISERAFHNVTGLERLDLSSNRLSAFSTRTFVQLASLRTLDVSGNALPFLPVAVQGLQAVVDLDLGANPLVRLKEKPESRAVMSKMERLLIRGTNLTTIEPTDFDLFPNLRELDITGNKLSRVAPYAFRSQAKLERLDLSRNDVLHLSRERLFGLTALRTLNLSRNLLASLDVFPRDLSGLAVLDLAHNRLRSFSRESLRYLSGLVRLDMKGNLLRQLYPEALLPLDSLRAVDLSLNHFQELPLLELSPVEDTLESVALEGESRRDTDLWRAINGGTATNTTSFIGGLK